MTQASFFAKISDIPPEKDIQLDLGLNTGSNIIDQRPEDSIPEGQLDFGLIKPERTATILITVPFGTMQTAESGLRSVVDGVGVVHLTAGDFDYEVGLYDQNIAEIESIRSQLRAVKGVRVNHTLVTMLFPERGIYTDITKVV